MSGSFTTPPTVAAGSLAAHPQPILAAPAAPASGLRKIGTAVSDSDDLVR